MRTHPFLRPVPTVALAADGLAARYPGQPSASLAVHDVSFRLMPGERVLLLGPNGAGKSTLVRIFAGLMRPASGEARVLGRPARQARHLVGVVGHTTYLYDELTGRENLRFYGDLYGVDKPRQRVDQLLAQVGLEKLADEPVGRLSRGQQQRVAIARALLHDPPVLLLDEPETGLDLAAFSLLADLAGAGDRTVLLTTHNIAAGLRLGSRVIVLARGRIVAEHESVSARDAGALSELLQRLGTAVRGAA